MSGYEHILVSLDLTDGSEYIAKSASKIVSAFNAKLSLAHVVVPVPVYSNPELDRLEAERIESAKEELVRVAKDLDVPESQQHIRVGSAKKEILQMAEDYDVDLIIVGSHSRHGLSKILGSTANAIINGAHCDVLTIRYHLIGED